MGRQYVREFRTEVGAIELEYNFKEVDGNQALDSLRIRVDGRAIDYPKAWSGQTTSTIIRKVCDLLKGR